MTSKDILLAVIIPLALAEIGPWCGWLAARLLPWAAKLRYADTERADVRLEEWSSDLGDIPGQLTKLAYAMGQLAAGSAVSVRRKTKGLRKTVIQSLFGKSYELLERRAVVYALRSLTDALRSNPSVSIIIPALNEARNLPHVLSTLPPWAEVELVDGGSVDDTVSVARRLMPDIKVVTTQRCTGKGGALRAGFAACSGDIIVTMDADGSADGRNIAQFVRALMAGADFAKGSRFTNGGGSDGISRTRRCVNRLLITLVNRVFGTQYTDLGSGSNAFWAQYLSAMQLDIDSGFEVDALMGIRAAEVGLRIQEIPSREYTRIHGINNLQSIVDARQILSVIMREKYGIGRRRRKLHPSGKEASANANDRPDAKPRR